MIPSDLLNTAALVLGFMSILWVVSVFLRDASIADPFWSILFVIISVSTVYQTHVTPGKLMVLSCVGLWGIRLFSHLLVRNLGKEEDYRYQAFRKQFGPERYWWVSYFQVFLLQGSLAFMISAPLLVACSAEGGDPIRLNDWVGGVLFAVGIFFEATADWQLTLFKRDPSTAGQVLRTGLWRYTRHPNYFGDSLVWWGLWGMCLDQPMGVWAIIGPITMTFFLMRVSGVPMLENRLRKTRPGYEDYIRQTSSFFPWPPREPRA